MNNKLLLVLATALSVAGAGARAQTTVAPAAAPSYSLTATATGVSQYMFRGQRLGGFSFQPALDYAAGNLALGVWSNFPVKDEVPDTSDPEFDFYGSYTFAVNNALSVVPAFTYYYYPNAPTNLGFYRGTFEPSIALNYTFEGLKLTPKLYYDMVLEGATWEFAAAYSIPLKDIGSELGLTAVYGTYKLDEYIKDSTPSTKAWGDYWSFDVRMPFAISAKSKLTLAWTYAEGKNAYLKTGTAPKTGNSLATGRGFVSVSWAYTF